MATVAHRVVMANQDKTAYRAEEAKTLEKKTPFLATTATTVSRKTSSPHERRVA